MLIAQFSDLHVSVRGERVLQRVDTAARLRTCLATLGSLRPQPDLLLLTGDLVDAAKDEEYAHLRELLAPVSIPVYVMPGNHDRRLPLRAAFAEHAYLGAAGPINFALDRAGLRIVALDSVIEGEDAGELGPLTREWLCATLAQAPGAPTLIAIHHPPIIFGVASVDAMGLLDAAAFGAIVRAHSAVVAIICGHIHRAMTARWNGTNVVVSPSVAQTLELDLAPVERMHYRLEPPAFCLHRWDGKVFATHYVQAGEFEGPYRYY